MATTAPEELERRFIEAAFNQGELGVIDEIFADDYLGHTSTTADPLDGPEPMKEYIEWVRTSFPDIELRLEHLVAEGNLVASQWLASETHEGELMGLEPTGETYQSRGMRSPASKTGGSPSSGMSAISWACSSSSASLNRQGRLWS